MLRIDIAGTASGAGKTTLIERLLPSLPGWGTVKVSIDRGDGHGHGPAGVVIATPETDRPGSDTERHRRAGSARTVWVRASPAVLGDLLDRALAGVGDLPGVLVEGNSPWIAREGDRLIVVVAPGEAASKETAPALLEEADLVVARQPTAHRRAVVADLRDPANAGTVAVVSTVLTWTRR